MRYDPETDSTAMSLDELAGLVAATGIARGPLAPAIIPASSPATASAFMSGTDSIPAVARDALLRAGAALADPERTSEIHSAIADEALRRLFVCSADTSADEVALLGRTGSEVQLALRTTGDVQAMLASDLGGSVPLWDVDLAGEMSAWAVIVLLAACDALRGANLRGMLEHAEPRWSFTRREVEERLVDSASEDYRWPLLFFAKVLTFDVAAVAGTDIVGRALDRLVREGLVHEIEAEGDAPAIYEMADGVMLLADGVMHDIAKVAATVHLKVAGGLSYESVLLVRAPDRLWMFDVSDAGGGVLSLSTVGLMEMAGTIAGVVPIPVE